MMNHEASNAVVAIIQARMGSRRLPGKVLSRLGGKPVLTWVTRAAANIVGVDKVVVATSDKRADDPIVEWCENNGVIVHRGSEEDVLARFHLAASREEAGTIIRLTADCPFLDPHVCAQVLTLFQMSGADYATNASPATWPDGLDCEVFSRNVLDQAVAEAKKPSEREHVTSFISCNQSRFKVVNLSCSIPGLQDERWTLDTPEDFDKLSQIAALLPGNRPPGFVEVLTAVRALPEAPASPSEEERNAGYSASLAAEKKEAFRDYGRSSNYLKRSLKTIPIGSQTFSKSYLQYPNGEAPLFASHGRGGAYLGY